MSRLIPPAIILIAALSIPSAAAAQNEPTGPHPRIWLTPETLESLRTLAETDPESAAALAVDHCAAIRADPERYASGVWRGFELAAHLSACALAYQITLDPADAEMALVYFEALLDDHDEVGDGLGGDEVVQRNHGYQMRVFAPWAAIGYDWLHAAPGMTPELRQRARNRFAAWTSWYREEGYLRDLPGTNYHAGYVFGTTLIAIAQGGEANSDLWEHVIESLWGTDMADAVAPAGVLDGGDWCEGWQYGPYSVLEYALAVRALNEQGVALPAFDRWAGSLVLRQLIARAPSGGGFIGGDSGDETPYRPIDPRTMFAVVAGTAPEESRERARAVIDELGLVEEEGFFVYQALAEARTGEAAPLPADAPTWYLAAGSQAFYARSDWSDDAVWAVSQCAPLTVADHQHLNAGNLVLSRGTDDVIVDPSPYASYSTLTGNAPTVTSANLPDTYRPSQGNWGAPTVGFDWARQTASGAVVSRCDYRGQYRFREELEPDVDYAVRDTAVLPHAGGATTVVIDRVRTGDAGRPLLLRFRTPGSLSLAGDVASGVVGGSSVHIRRLHSNGGEPAVSTPPVGDCYTEGVDRGKCVAARFAVDQYELSVPHAAPLAVHVIDAAAQDAAAPDAELIEGDGYVAAVLDRTGERFAVIAADRPDADASSLTYRVPAGGARLHVVVDAPRGDGGRAEVSASSDGGDCEVTVASTDGDGGLVAEPLVVQLSDSCDVSEDPATDPLEPPGSDGTVGEGSGDGGAGCCRSGRGVPAPGAVLLAGIVLAALARRRR